MERISFIFNLRNGLIRSRLRKFTCGNKRLEFNQDALIKFQALNCWLHHTLFISL